MREWLGCQAGGRAMGELLDFLGCRWYIQGMLLGLIKHKTREKNIVHRDDNSITASIEDEWRKKKCL
jgi:hypothetical protein